MIEWEATVNVEMLYVALPLLSVPVPSVVLPSLKVTVPVAAVGVTVAVNVTAVPAVEGLAEEVSVTEVLVFPKPIPVKATQQRTTTKTRHVIRITIRTSSFSNSACAHLTEFRQFKSQLMFTENRTMGTPRCHVLTY